MNLSNNNQQFNKTPIPFTGASFIIMIFLLSIENFSCSDYHSTNSKPEKYNYNTSDILYDYHQLYLELESKDIYIAPVISARFLLSLNIVIQECFQYAANKINYEADNDFSDLLIQQKISDSLLLNNMLNETLSKHLKNLFVNRVLQADKIINEKYLEIKKMANIQEQDNIQSDIISVSEGISRIVFENLLPCEYIRYPDLTIRDSVSVKNNILKKEINIRYVRNMKLYESFLPALQVKEIDRLEFKTFLFPDTVDFYRNAMEIYTISQPLTQEKKWIAEFWSDDLPGVTFSPVTRWISILNQILKDEKLTTEQTKKIYFLMSLAMHETVVECWNYKYYYMIFRPSSIIKSNIDSNWTPFHENPDFPAYPSGHACFAACGTTVLEHFFGNDYPFTDNSHTGNKAFLSDPRSYNNFEEMAQENAQSRMFLGVHFRKDCEDGLLLGKTLTNQVINSLESKK